jgi:transcriptional antiterminator RfaH
MKCWYTLYTKPNAEYQVATSLQRRGIQTYLPELETMNGHQQRVRKPFFPCYLFARVDFDTIGLSHIRWTPGLRCVVAFGEAPVSLSDEVINMIQHRLEELHAGGDQPLQPFQPGERVRITQGPLQGMLGIFDSQTTSSQRVQVLLTMLGQASRAQVPVAHLERAPHRAEAPAPKRSRRTRGRGRHIKQTA